MSWKQRHPEKKHLSGDVPSEVMSQWPTSSGRLHFCVAGAAVNSPVDWIDESSWYLIRQSPHVLGTRCSKQKLFRRICHIQTKTGSTTSLITDEEVKPKLWEVSQDPMYSNISLINFKDHMFSWNCGGRSEYNEHIAIMHQSWFECTFVVENLKKILTYVSYVISDLWESDARKMMGCKFAFDVKIFVAL